MEHAALIFSLLFFIAATIYTFWGIYIIKLNSRSSVNLIFLLMCISLSIWSLGFGMANIAATIDRALFWRRISAIGWTSMHSLTLHFLILLTSKKNNLKNQWYLPLIHIPAFINMYIYSLSYSVSAVQYNLINSKYGWVNISLNNMYDWFFNLYYGLYTVVGLILVWRWKEKFKDKKISKQANLIFITIFIVLLLGSFTDIVANGILMDPIPQMGPLFILIPVFAMYYAAKKYDFIEKENINKDEIILTREDRKSLFNNMGLAFYVGAILSFIFEYISITENTEGVLSQALIRSGILFALGFVVRIAQRINDEKTKENATIALLLISIPLVSIQFLEYGSKTVWVFPIIIIMSALIFNNKKLLVSSTIVAIITQRLIWILKPEATVTVDSYDYITRMGLLAIASFVGSRVNNIYISRFKENTDQTNFQKINSEISFDFVHINQENFDEKIDNLLFKLGEYFKVDRTYLFLIDREKKCMTYSHEWCNDGIEAEVGTIEEMPLDVFPWWIDQLKNNQLVYIEDVNDMPKEAVSEQEQLLRQNVKSLVSVPVEADNEILAFIGLDSVNSFKIWSSENIKLLNIMSNLIANGLMKIKSEEEVKFMAYYDHSTKLPNRFLFSERVNQAIQMAKRNDNFVAVMFLDLDNFKSINDTMGHSSGDALLSQVGQTLVKRLRDIDTVARFGGDEFMVMINSIKDYKDIGNIAEKIMGIFSERFDINGQQLFITGSAGLATYPIDGNSSEELIKNADIAMYQAKGKGKNQYVICAQAMKEEVEGNMMLSNDLYSALEGDELIVYYQPQIDLHTGEISGLEALLRWVHPEKGMIAPSVFIPLAEKNGLINRIGAWVLETACIQNKAWQDMGYSSMKMGVNLSAVQFANPTLADDIEKILKESKLDPKYLEIEITESIAIKEADHVLEVLNKLKELGLSIAIDDFGTEYSSLSRLKNLPIDRIKIDMEFIQGIESNEKDKAITMIIINLAKSLGLNVLAEGVETLRQLDFLNQKMCDYVQGYYYYKPMPAEEFEKILEMSKTNRLKLNSWNS